MKEIKIAQSTLLMPAEGEKPESHHVAQEINLLQFPNGNQTLLQNNMGMHKDAVTLNPDQLLELIRKSNVVLEPMRDAYVQEATDHIARGNKMLLDRLEQVTNEELKTYLRSHIDRNQSNLLKAKGAFYTPRHELYMALCSSIPAAITLLFADERMANDENLLEALKAIEEPVDMSAFNTEMQTLFSRMGTGPNCTGNRMQMYAPELKEPTTLDLSLKHQGVKNLSETKPLTPEQIRERNAADSQGGPDGLK